MNRKQRQQNRLNAEKLYDSSVVCPECLERGRHYYQLHHTLEDIMSDVPPTGFYICRKFYDESGKRISQ